MTKTDVQVTKDIFDELTFDPSLDASDISVGTKNGIVTMTGMVRTYAEKIAAEHAVKRVFGVRGLAEELQVDIPKLHQRTDAEIVAAALNILKWDASLPRDTVTVKVENKWLTLDGAVPWEFQREHARHMVSSLIGVRGVTNQITVPTRPTAGDVKQKIHDTFVRSAVIDADKLSIETKTGGTVVLNGSVHSFNEQESAIRAAYSVPGVTRVESHTQVI